MSHSFAPLPYNILIGPLYSPMMMGSYQHHPQIQIFSTVPERFANPSGIIVYDDSCMTDFFKILERLPSGWLPDAVIWCDMSYQSLPPGIEHCPYPLGLVAGDWNVCYATILDFAPLFDRIFTDRRLKGLLLQSGYDKVDWWPCFFYDPQKCYPIPGLKKEYDIAFIGNLNAHVHPQRNRFLTRLLQLGERYRLFIRQGIYDEAYNRVLNQSRIVFNYTICGVANLRVFEAPACGALLFTESENLEIRDFFQDRQECVLYDADNLEYLLDYYLTHADERLAIAAQGQARVAEYTYEKRFSRLLGLVPDMIQNFGGANSRPFHWLAPYQKQLMRVKNGYYSLHKEAAHHAIVSFQPVISATTDPPIRVKYLNALATALVSNELGMTRSPQFTTMLEQARLLLEQALVLEPEHPLLHYHLGFCLDHLQQNQLAQQHYLKALTCLDYLYWQERQWTEWFVMPLGYNRFKMAWERCGFSESKANQPAAFLRILKYQVLCLLGKTYQRQQQFVFAIEHFHQALTLAAAQFEQDYELMELSEDNGGAAYELSECLQAIGQISEAIAICQAAVNKHPLWIKARLQLYQLWLQNRQWQDVLDGTAACLALLKMLDWHELPDVFNNLQRWAKLGLALEQGLPLPEIVARLPAQYSEYANAQALQLVQAYASDYLHLYQGLVSPLALQWSSPWPEYFSAEIDWQPSATASIDIQWLGHTYTFERSLLAATDLNARRLGPDLLPLAFLPTTLSVPFELEGAGAMNVLVVLSDWLELSSWWPIFWGLDSITWLLWQPGGGPDEATMAQIETWLEPHPELAVVILSESMDALTQQGLLQHVQLVVGSHMGPNPFYLAWAVWLGIPFICWGEPLTIKGLPAPPEFYTQEPTPNLAQFAVEPSIYQRLALECQQQYHQFYQVQGYGMPYQLWWDIRLYLLLQE